MSPLRLPFRHGPEEADSTEDTAILEAINTGSLGQLGVLLGVHDPELGKVIAAWPNTSKELRGAIVKIVSG